MNSIAWNEEKPRKADAAKTDRRLCDTPGCKTYIGKGRYADSYADVIVNDRGICLCADCYLNVLYAAGKGSMSEITGRNRYLTLELVRAHWAKLDAAEAEKNAKRGSP